MRLIDADALIDEVKHITGQDTIMWFYDRRIKREQEVNMEAFIELMPTIDPVKHGKWIADKYTRKCSECESTYWMREGNAWNYCPNCGSKNGGEG